MVHNLSKPCENIVTSLDLYDQDTELHLKKELESTSSNVMYS